MVFSLITNLTILHREDLLDFGDGKRIKKIKAAKWDISRKTIDNHTIVPKYELQSFFKCKKYNRNI